VSPLDIDAIIEATKLHGIDLVVVGPEAPLAAGLIDRLDLAGVAAFGPVAAAAKIEASKAFAHEIMDAAQVPCAKSWTFDNVGQAINHLETCDLPVVIKADGLAAGKGVVIAQTRQEALDTANSFLVDRKLGDSGATLVVEEFLVGEEASFMVLTDGEAILPLDGARDHKRIFDGDQGPNTGGMGAYSPTPLLDEAAQRQILETVIKPVLAELERRGITYKGVLYAGLMFTDAGPKVLEFNCRFGDPETQPLLYRLRGDLAEIMMAVAHGRLSEVSFSFDPRPAVCVVMSSGGYPDTPKTGDVITGLDDASRIPDTRVFHSGTKLSSDGATITSGGRVLAVTSIGTSMQEARETAYKAVKTIHFNDMHYRTDIAAIKP
jgi:phosphoribosylamine--glycine ligase